LILQLAIVWALTDSAVSDLLSESNINRLRWTFSRSKAELKVLSYFDLERGCPVDNGSAFKEFRS